MLKVCVGCSQEFETELKKPICKNCKLPNHKFMCRYICEQCNCERIEPRNCRPRFCSRSCSNKWQHVNGLRKVGFNPKRSTYSYWVEKYGSSRAEELMCEYRSKMSVAILSADMTHQKDVARVQRIAYNISTKGKTLEEIHGVEKATQIRAKLSEATMGSKNPAYGKSYKNGGRSVKGYYKGKFFRSLLEYSFMKHLESEGLSIEIDVDYECFVVPYFKGEVERTYRIDFYVPQRKIVYEVKQSYALKKISIENQLKWYAAKLFFDEKEITFKVVTELDFPKIVFDIARLDNDITWKEETFKYFKGGK